jgi:hypothetical protein
MDNPTTCSDSSGPLDKQKPTAYVLVQHQPAGAGNMGEELAFIPIWEEVCAVSGHFGEGGKMAIPRHLFVRI